MNDSLVSRLRDLKLSGIIKTLDVRNEEALKNNLSYMEFFELLINDEVLNRQNNSNIKRTSKAKFPQHKTLEEYNFNYQPNINKRFIYNLATCEFVHKKENVAFIGPIGTGKTHLAISIGLKAVAQGYKVLFTTVNEML
ncbi:ATP-binding protein [Caloramator australicus]|uniref:Transposase n=1 Tax=Caloramator australicus RC3 TaxID=857293 RepID=I7J596_9CLOT|nr:ATP-binding protein [Caloramator australicus]CCJ33581.1 Transposase [Caloramator australicus RC3]